MKDLIFILTLLILFGSVILFTIWCDKQIEDENN